MSGKAVADEKCFVGQRPFRIRQLIMLLPIPVVKNHPVLYFADVKIVAKQGPVLRERIAQRPIANAAEVVFFDGVKFGLSASGVLKPDFVFPALFVPIAEVRGLGGSIIVDGCAVADSSGYGFLHTECFGFLTGDMGQQPIPGVYLEAEIYFFPWDCRNGIIEHSADLV